MKAFRVTVDGFGDPPMEVTKYAKSRSAARMATARDIVEAGWHDRVDAGLLRTIRRVVRAPELDEPERHVDPAMTAAHSPAWPSWKRARLRRSTCPRRSPTASRTWSPPSARRRG